jgi:hypothetical protein
MRKADTGKASIEILFKDFLKSACRQNCRVHLRVNSGERSLVLMITDRNRVTPGSVDWNSFRGAPKRKTPLEP